jgi:hypothetical protein
MGMSIRLEKGVGGCHGIGALDRPTVRNRVAASSAGAASHPTMNLTFRFETQWCHGGVTGPIITILSLQKEDEIVHGFSIGLNRVSRHLKRIFRCEATFLVSNRPGRYLLLGKTFQPATNGERLAQGADFANGECDETQGLLGV